MQSETGFLAELMVMLGVAAILVPLFKKAGLGSVLGYLFAGLAIGSSGLGLIQARDGVQAFSEIGILLVLFVIGLEFQFNRLWALRKQLFLWGGAQVFATASLFYLTSITSGLSSVPAVTVSVALALSSTSLASQVLGDRHQIATNHGRSCMEMLSFHNLAIIPILVIIPLLSPAAPATGIVDILLFAARALFVPAVLIVGGRYLLRPFFRFVSAAGYQDTMAAGALFVVFCTAWLTDSFGLPRALGAILAGILLADSEYRHEVEFRVEPFKGLLVGLFFMSMGMTADVRFLFDNLLTTMGLTVGLIATKMLVIVLVGKLHNYPTQSAINLGITLSQSGEFSLVVLVQAIGNQLIDYDLLRLHIIVIVLSMTATPLLIALNRFLQKCRANVEHDDVDVDSRKLRIFISYSHSQAAQAERLVSLLESKDFDVTMDSRDLPFGEEWQEELAYYIRQSDTVIWLVSLASIRSKWCVWELEQVAEYGKRLVPIAVEEVVPTLLPDQIGKVQILPRSGTFDPTDAAQVQLLTDVLRTNRAWLKEHTRLAERARLWAQAGRSSDWLLRGEELVAAEKWRDEAPQTAPDPGAAVLDLIHSSRNANAA